MDILAGIYVSERHAHKLAGCVIVELPELPIAGCEQLLMPTDEARPNPSYLEIAALRNSSDTVKLPCITITVSGDTMQLPDVACITPPVIAGVVRGVSV